MTSKAGIKRIVVGVDGSTNSYSALKWAIRMAKALGSQITAVYAVNIPVYFLEPYSIPVQFDDEWRQEIKDEFENKWCKALKTSGVRYRTVMEDGRPATVIAGVADREAADLIVIARRGRGEVRELLLGSVSHELALHSKRPVLLIEPEPAGTARRQR
ncbi:MAG: universal stress protein [Candidatus Dormibacter sp.]